MILVILNIVKIRRYSNLLRRNLKRSLIPKDTPKNTLFPRLLRRLRARILMYDLYIAVLRAEPPYTHEKITIFRCALTKNQHFYSSPEYAIIAY